jgi:hypothetical protein
MSLEETGFQLTCRRRFIASQYVTYLTEQRIPILKSLLDDLEILCNDSTTGSNIRHITENIRNIIDYKKNSTERYLEPSIKSVMLSINNIESTYELYQLFYLINPFLAEQQQQTRV